MKKYPLAKSFITYINLKKMFWDLCLSHKKKLAKILNHTKVWTNNFFAQKYFLCENVKVQKFIVHIKFSEFSRPNLCVKRKRSH